jgi:hypothetical protein
MIFVDHVPPSLKRLEAPILMLFFFVSGVPELSHCFCLSTSFFQTSINNHTSNQFASFIDNFMHIAQ